MSNNDVEKYMQYIQQVNSFYGRKHLVVLDPGKESTIEDSDEIVHDTVKWELSDVLKAKIAELTADNSKSDEDKILGVYEAICQNYEYDDNLTFHIRKNYENGVVTSYSVGDWYGRTPDEEWQKNREGHKRRVCYELSRYLAKSLEELFKDNDSLTPCILWDSDNIHYFVGLIGDDYSATLDLDDFTGIKDLTRLKTGLTAKGIKIISGNSDCKLTQAVERYNSDKEESEIVALGGNKPAVDSIDFLKEVMNVLVDRYNIDSQGFFECVKTISDNIGVKRGKVWKKLEGFTDKNTRYIRCLVIDDGTGKKYLADSDKRDLVEIDEKGLPREKFITKPESVEIEPEYDGT